MGKEALSTAILLLFCKDFNKMTHYEYIIPFKRINAVEPK
jgi:hypothetical protein